MRTVLGTRPLGGRERLNSSRNVKSVTEPDFRVHGRQEADKASQHCRLSESPVFSNYEAGWGTSLLLGFLFARLLGRQQSWRALCPGPNGLRSHIFPQRTRA